jgi:hypothetical protein
MFKIDGREFNSEKEFVQHIKAQGALALSRHLERPEVKLLVSMVVSMVPEGPVPDLLRTLLDGVFDAGVLWGGNKAMDLVAGKAIDIIVQRLGGQDDDEDHPGGPAH